MPILHKTLSVILFAICYLITTLAYAQPKSVVLSYEVSRNGKTFGTVKENYQQKGNRYQIKSVTKGDGIYALLGERVLTSEGEVTDHGLKPNSFKLLRGDNKHKSLTARFNWQAMQLKMLAKGEERKAKLVRGAQDLASYVYQFMYDPPKVGKVNVSVTTGKRFNHYTYNIKAQDVLIKTADGKTYKTLHLVNAEKDGKKKKELWLAPALHFLPVKYLVVDKHGDQLEQTLSTVVIQ